MDKLTQLEISKFLKDKIFSNKINRGVGITQMKATLVPQEHGMEVTGHQDLISYGK